MNCSPSRQHRSPAEADQRRAARREPGRVVHRLHSGVGPADSPGSAAGTANAAEVFRWGSGPAKRAAEAMGRGQRRVRLTAQCRLTLRICNTFKYLKNLYSVPSRVWTPPSPLSCNFCRLRDDFDDDGHLVSTALIALSARSNPTARRRRNHLEVCKSSMAKVTRMTTLSMGQSVP